MNARLTRRRLVAGAGIVLVAILLVAWISPVAALLSTGLVLLDPALGSRVQRWSGRLGGTIGPVINPVVRPLATRLGARQAIWSPSFDDAGVFRQAGVAAQVMVNQLGYRPGDPKEARLTRAATQFTVVDRTSGRAVYQGQPRWITDHDPASGDAVYGLDFSTVTTPGQYYLQVPGVGRSFDFQIAEDVYASALATVLRGFYLQRCGAPIVDDRWGRPACHLADATVWGSDTHVPATGGWHDAGDYGKYLPSAGRAVHTLLTAYEFYAGRFPVTATPGRSLPRVLDEVKWELDWLLKLQGPDGGVHHKVTNKGWDGYVTPDQDHSTRYAFEVSSAGTADFAAMLAAASRIYAPFDPAFARGALAAAERAWGYLEQHPTIVPPGGFQNPPGVSTGAYADADDGDERFWAAAELFRATGKPVFDAYVVANFRRFRPFFEPPPQNMQVQGPGALAYILAADRGGDPSVRQTMVADLLYLAAKISEKVSSQAFRVALAPSEYYWGSNGVDLSYALTLLYAERVSSNPDFAVPALDQVHYLFGCNALNKCFVTGLGKNPVMRPHSQAAIAAQWQVPPAGMLSGGPNAMQSGKLSPYPAKDYADDSANFTVNETAIDMNGALVLVLARFAGPDLVLPPPIAS
jgi:endoglucanase